MLTQRDLLYALDAAEDRWLLDAERALSLSAPAPVKQTRKFGRVLLLAAVIASLMTLTAYAAGWLGLKERVMESPQPAALSGWGEDTQSGGWLTFNGPADSPEARAAAEWEDYYWAHVEQAPENTPNYPLPDFGADTDTAGFYGAADAEMLQSLKDIAAKYRLNLHREAVTPMTHEQFYTVTGLAPCLEGDGIESWSCKQVYEDGSFSLEGWGQTGGQALSFSLNRSLAGTLSPASMYLRDAETFAEWPAEQNGREMVFALRGGECFVFCDFEDCFLRLHFMCGMPRDDSAEEPAQPLTREVCERFAACFDFAALSGGETDLTRLTGRRAVEAVPKNGLLSFETFFASPEYRMAAAFQHAFGDWTDMQHADDRDFWTSGQYVREWHYLPFPTGVDTLDAQLAAGLEEYGLQIPTAARAVCFGDWVDPALLLSPAAHKDPAPQAADPGAAEALIGIDGLLPDGAVQTACRWDNGAWQALVSCGSGSYELIYVPKGAFCPVVGEALHTDAASWTYDSACGEQLMLTLGGEAAYPRFPTAMALCETDSAYVLLKAQGVTDAAVLQDFCDATDFTALP